MAKLKNLLSIKQWLTITDSYHTHKPTPTNILTPPARFHGHVISCWWSRLRCEVLCWRERECVCVYVYLFVCVCVESGCESSVCVPQDQLLLDQVPQDQLLILYVKVSVRWAEFHARCHSYSTYIYESLFSWLYSTLLASNSCPTLFIATLDLCRALSGTAQELLTSVSARV